MPLVSVIITTYNRRDFLKDALRSVLSQDYEDKEIIVVDDGSTDGSEDEVKGLPIRYLRKENGGISSARNAGLHIARGEFIAFLDVDDLWKKKKLSTQVAVMNETGVPLTYTDEIWIKNGKRINQKKRHRKYSGHIFEHCLPLCIISASSAVINRSVFERVGLFDESLPVCEDYDMWLRITGDYPVLFIEKPFIVKQGGHGDQLSRAYTGMDRFRIASIVKILESGSLSKDLAEKAVGELERKCHIYAQGAMKRGKPEEGQHYLSLIAKYANTGNMPYKTATVS